ncbi:oligosaccharide flippase family protein [Aliikangiella marina]|uniref:oligosaccharide flippase family protein n=1 Tax=Aliikangiella marina TaxID=1712262 RepID=UPI002482EA46|nr:oligosaccharide flippase family protein [Aliikangiella marina]
MFKASSWVLIGYVVSQVLRLGSNLIMTRLLVPEMFGIMALCQTFLYILAMISDVGIGPNIIRSKRGEESEFLNTAWTLQILRGAFICLLVVLAALGIGYAQTNQMIGETSAFSEPQLPIILAVMSLTAFISGFKSTNLILANRNIQLTRLTILELISQLFGLVVMIAWAFIAKSIWALVAGALVSAVSLVLLSHFAFPGVANKFKLERAAVSEIINYGKWILLTSIVTAMLNQGDRLILGSLVDATTLGIYSIALFLSTSLLQAFMKLNGMVFFPLLSEVARERENELAEVYYKIRRTTDAAAISMAGFLFAFGETLINFLYDDRYQAAGPMLQILALALMLTSPSISSAIYFAIGKPKYVTIMVTIESIVKLTLLPTLYVIGGMNLAVWAVALFTISIIPIDFYYKHKLGILNLFKEFRMLPCFALGYLLGWLISFLF